MGCGASKPDSASHPEADTSASDKVLEANNAEVPSQVSLPDSITDTPTSPAIGSEERATDRCLSKQTESNEALQADMRNVDGEGIDEAASVSQLAGVTKRASPASAEAPQFGAKLPQQLQEEQKGQEAMPDPDEQAGSVDETGEEDESVPVVEDTDGSNLVHCLSEAEEKHGSDKDSGGRDGDLGLQEGEQGKAIDIIVVPQTTEGKVQIEIQWSAAEHCDCTETFSMGDSLVLVPCALGWSWDEDPWNQLASVQPSGNAKGSIVMELTGLIGAECKYEVHYIVALEDGSSRDLGKSDPFYFGSGEVPQLSESELESVQMQARQANATSAMQHFVNEAKAKTDVVEWNPLLTIEPHESTWKKLLREMEDGKQVRLERAQALSQEQQQHVFTKSRVPIPINSLLDEQQLTAAVMAGFDNTPGFIYAGAGVSMSPPSCSPSWWRLMNDLLSETFARAPPQFASAVQHLSQGDVSRQPEEIMETYYLVFKEKLFTLFQLLDKGEPNANHIGMAKLAKAGRLTAILTTNFDIFIERALALEGIPYTVVVTSEEFERYCLHGCEGIAILKIHGTIDRPDTIVAVSNHYKMGKGFGGWKATATSRLMKDCPTLFLGYSGWDFMHKNYQDFWAAQAEVGGQPVFWMTNKHIPKTRPDLRKLVGTHIGDRLQLGASALPDLLMELLAEWDDGGRKDVVRVHEEGASAKAAVEAERAAFVREWVLELPTVPVMSLLLIESLTLNKSSQERLKKSKEAAREAEGAGDSAEMAAFYMQLAAEMAAGKISMEDYLERIELSTLDLTLVHLQMPKATKDEIKQLVRDVIKAEPMFADPTSGLKHWFPSMILAAGDGVDYDCTAQEVVEKVLGYLKKWVFPLVGKEDRRSVLLRETYSMVTAPLKCANAEESDRVCRMVEEHVDMGLEAKWDDERFQKERHSSLQKKIDIAVTGSVDTIAVVESQVQLTLEAARRGDVDAVLRDGMSIGLGLVRMAPLRTMELWDSKGLVDLNMKMHDRESTGGELQGGDETLDWNELYAIEDELPMTTKLAPVCAAVNTIMQSGERVDECANVLAALDLAVGAVWLEVFPYLGNAYALGNAMEHRGYYPVAPWPKECQGFAVDRFLHRPRFQTVTEERILQPLLAAKATVALNVGNFEVMLDACTSSLALTEGKVTELTPAPIPECLAVAFQSRGAYQEASQWYSKAMDGLRTSVMRHKADAIVLNACLVQATIDKREALAWALKTSPFFGSAQQFSMVGPGRSLLVQQCERWAVELGYASLSDAESKLTGGE